MHSTETELKSKCISNITVHINIYKRRVYLRKRLFSISPRPPRLFHRPITVILNHFQPPPDYSHPPFIRYSRVPYYFSWYGDVPLLVVLFQCRYGIMGIIFTIFRHVTELWVFFFRGLFIISRIMAQIFIRFAELWP